MQRTMGQFRFYIKGNEDLRQRCIFTNFIFNHRPATSYAANFIKRSRSAAGLYPTATHLLANNAYLTLRSIQCSSQW